MDWDKGRENQRCPRAPPASSRRKRPSPYVHALVRETAACTRGTASFSSKTGNAIYRPQTRDGRSRSDVPALLCPKKPPPQLARPQSRETSSPETASRISPGFGTKRKTRSESRQPAGSTSPSGRVATVHSGSLSSKTFLTVLEWILAGPAWGRIQARGGRTYGDEHLTHARHRPAVSGQAAYSRPDRLRRGHLRQLPPEKHTEQKMMTAIKITMSRTIICTLKFCHHILFRRVRPVLWNLSA